MGLVAWLLIACAAAIPLGTRFFVVSVIPGFHEYEAVFVYASDVLLLLFAAITWRTAKQQLRELFHAHGGVLLFVLLIAGLASATLAPSFWLAVYALIRLCLLGFFAYAIGVVARKTATFQAVIAAIAVMGILQAGLGVAQFSQQQSVGLARFGEPALVPYSGAASTVPVAGGRVLRVYGTFPHPNIYAAFLALSLLSLAYWYLWCEQQLATALFKHPRSWWTLPHALKTLNEYLTNSYFFWRLGIAGGSFLVLLGLALSFSRSGWISAAVGSVALCGLLLVRRHMPGGVLRLALMLAACASAVYLLLAPLLTARAHLSRTEKAVSERITYNIMGLELLQDRLGGVGIGNQVLYGAHHRLYQQHGLMKVWHWEPIHNLYLLAAVELGWLGLLSFMGFLGIVTWQLLKASVSMQQAVALSLLAALLVGGLFDHFLWTLQPGRLTLWLVIGLALSQLPVGKRR